MMGSWKLVVLCWIVFIRFDVVLCLCKETGPEVPHSSSNATGAVLNNGVTVMITCNSGYGGMGNEIYRCVNDTWIGDYNCLRLCEKIENLENGKIINKPSYRAGSRIIFECNNGYNIKGSSSLLCRTDGKWRPDPPTCQIVKCKEFGNVPNGHTSQETANGMKNVYGNKVTVTCDLGYVRSGLSEVYCGADGNWGPKPVCRPSSCGSHPGSNSSCIEDTDLTDDGTLITYLCKAQSSDKSVTKAGSGTAVCFDNEWDEPDTGCYCDCKIEANFAEVKVKNLENGKFLKHGTELIWACAEGYIKDRKADIFCNDGKCDIPKCVPDSNVKEKTSIENASIDTSTRNAGGLDREPNLLIPLIPVISAIAFVVVAIIVVVFMIKKRKLRGSEKPKALQIEEFLPEKEEMLSIFSKNNHADIE